MIDDQINSAMAEACPGVFVRPVGHAGWNYRSSIHGRILPCINGNIFDDLNAMHEAEKAMYSTASVYRYTVFLDNITTRNEWHATARQRAEAYLRTIGKWAE